MVGDSYPLVMTNIAMENGPFVGDVPGYKPSLIGNFPASLDDLQFAIKHVPRN